MTQTLTFTSVSQLGGISHDVVQAFYEVMRAHERSVRPDLDDITHELIRSDLESPHADLDYSGIWWRGTDAVMALFVQHDDPARNVSIDGYGVPELPADSFRILYESALPFAKAKAATDSDSFSADQLEGKVDLNQPDSRIWQLQMFCREEDQRYRSFLESIGLVHVRNFFRMTIDLDETHDRHEKFPDVELVAAVTEPLQRELQQVTRDSFREHWGSSDVERTFEEWKALRESGPGFTWDRAWIARVGGKSAGLLNVTDMLIEENTDYVWTLGVLKEFRGRGLAKWLLRKSFVDARKRGLAKVALNVDAENSTGAVGLYEAVGMRATETYVAYRAPIR